MPDSSSEFINWNTVPSASSLISIGTHSLYLSVSGPPQVDPSKPLIIVLAGAGDISASWHPVSRLISPSFRTVLYDRSGLGNSFPRPPSPTPLLAAVTAARELHALLQAAKLTAPYVLCAHSYGAIIAREFIDLYPNSVAGMVSVDGSTERQADYFRIPDPNIAAVLGNLSFARVTGLREEAEKWMTREEWRERAILMSKGMDALAEEGRASKEVCETLKGKRQFEKCVLGDKPLSVISASGKRDHERIYEKGVEAGNGTEEQRKEFRKLLDRWDIERELKEEQLRLSRNSRLVVLEDCGHNVQLTRPDVVAEEIRWVMDSLKKGSSLL